MSPACLVCVCSPCDSLCLCQFVSVMFLSVLFGLHVSSVSVPVMSSACLFCTLLFCSPHLDYLSWTFASVSLLGLYIWFVFLPQLKYLFFSLHSAFGSCSVKPDNECYFGSRHTKENKVFLPILFSRPH